MIKTTSELIVHFLGYSSVIQRVCNDRRIPLNVQNRWFMDCHTIVVLDYCFTLCSRSFYLLCKYYSLCSVLLRVSDCVLTLHKIRCLGLLFHAFKSFTLFYFVKLSFIFSALLRRSLVSLGQLLSQNNT